MEAQEKFESWAIVELMGHRRIAGRVTEQVIGGAALLRIDVPQCPEIAAHEENDPYWPGHTRTVEAKPFISGYTQFYGAAAIYCLTPTTEEIAVRVTTTMRERPIALFDVAPRVSPMLSASPPVSDVDEEEMER
jgi:hypothetical protein